MCFAAVCYLYKHLKDKHLHVNATLCIASLFGDISEGTIIPAMVKYPSNQTEETPKFTCIPPHVLPMMEMKNTRDETKSLLVDLIENSTKETNAQGFEYERNTTEKIMDLITTVAAKQIEAIVNRLREKTIIAAKSSIDAASRSALEYINP